MGATIRDLGFSSKILVGDICNRFRAFHVLKKSSKRVNFQVTSYELSHLLLLCLSSWPFSHHIVWVYTYFFVYQVGHCHIILFGFILSFLSVVDKAHWAMRTCGMAKAKYAKRCGTHVPFLISDYFLKRFYFCFYFMLFYAETDPLRGWGGGEEIK